MAALPPAPGHKANGTSKANPQAPPVRQRRRQWQRRRPEGEARPAGGGGMKLVIFGLTVSSSWGNGHATLWRGLWRALARRGHRIVFFERDVPYYAGHRDLTALPGGELVLYRGWDEALPQATARTGRRRRGDGHVLLPGRSGGGRPGAQLFRGGEDLLRPRHADHVRAPPRRRNRRVPAAGRARGLRPGPQLHRRGGAGRAAIRARRTPGRAAVRERRSRGALPGSRGRMRTGRTSRTSAPTPPTGSRRSNRSWSNRPGGCRTSGSSSAGRSTRTISRGRRTSTSSATCPRRSTRRSSARRG